LLEVGCALIAKFLADFLADDFLADFLPEFLAEGGMPLRTINRALRREILYMLKPRVAP
jgi:hypothetical protein